MNNQSLIFIPDISGFTDFVKSTELEHSGHLIGELLELLIDQNELDLELAEIEGDALFFYKQGEMPSHDAIERQAKRMYQAFHKHLQVYESHRICRCGACTTASNLQLKFIVHAGDFNFVTVKNQTKPHGPCVIAAHRLLKNDIESDEYLLISHDCLSCAPRAESDISWADQSQLMDVGNLDYAFAHISEWRKSLHEIPDPQQGSLAKPIMDHEVTIAADPEELFELLTNFKYRLKFSEVEGMEYDKNRVNRVGSKHICVFGTNSVEFETVHRDFGTGLMVYGERTEEVPGFHYMDTYYILEPNEGTTRLEARVYGKPKRLGVFLAPIIRRKLGGGLRKQMHQLKSLAETEGLPVN